MINENVRHIVEAELQPGETLLWADRPAQISIDFIGLLICSFSAGWISLGSIMFIGASKGQSEINSVFGPVGTKVVFTLATLFLIYSSMRQIFGPSKQIYALTNKRGIIFDHFLSKRIVNLAEKHLLSASLEFGSKFGTLDFEEHPKTPYSNGWSEMPRCAFSNIPNPKSVQALIKTTFNGYEREKS